MRHLDEAKQSFAIRKDSLGHDEAWRDRRSDSSTYKIEDFDFSDATSLSETSITRSYWSNFWRPISSGLVAIFVVFVVNRLVVKEGDVSFWIGQSYFELPAATTLATVVAVLFLIYVGFLFAENPQDITIKPMHYDKWRYVVPGWQPCHFTFGSEGIAVDGTHFLYFLEWADLNEVIESTDKLVLRNFNEHVLTIPKHFFNKGNGGDISWPEVSEYIKKYKPPKAKLKNRPR